MRKLYTLLAASAKANPGEAQQRVRGERQFDYSVAPCRASARPTLRTSMSGRVPSDRWRGAGSGPNSEWSHG